MRPCDLESLSRFLGECLPDVDPQPPRSCVCMYTLTPDRHFVVDRHPDHEHVSFGAGFSGHGFKFTPVIGEVLVDLAIEGRTTHPIEFLSQVATQSRSPRNNIERTTGEATSNDWLRHARHSLRPVAGNRRRRGRLEALMVRMLTHKGMYEAEARIGAARLIEADLRGIHSHGSRSLWRYLEAMDTGGIDPRAQVVTERETPAIAVLNAGKGLGHVAATKAMQLAIEKARTVGTGTVAIRQGQHYGAASVYALMAVEAGMIGFSTTSTGTASVAAYGSRKPAPRITPSRGAFPRDPGRRLCSTWRAASRRGARSKACEDVRPRTSARMGVGRRRQSD